MTDPRVLLALEDLRRRRAQQFQQQSQQGMGQISGLLMNLSQLQEKRAQQEKENVWKEQAEARAEAQQQRAIAEASRAGERHDRAGDRYELEQAMKQRSRMTPNVGPNAAPEVGPPTREQFAGVEAEHDSREAYGPRATAMAKRQATLDLAELKRARAAETVTAKQKADKHKSDLASAARRRAESRARQKRAKEGEGSKTSKDPELAMIKRDTKKWELTLRTATNKARGIQEKPTGIIKGAKKSRTEWLADAVEARDQLRRLRAEEVKRYQDLGLMPPPTAPPPEPGGATGEGEGEGEKDPLEIMAAQFRVDLDNLPPEIVEFAQEEKKKNPSLDTRQAMARAIQRMNMGSSQ